MTPDDKKRIEEIRARCECLSPEIGDPYFLLTQLDEAHAALRDASKILNELGFVTIDGDTAIVKRDAWEDAMAMRDKIDSDLKALGEE